jgi:hypothetical protein
MFNTSFGITKMTAYGPETAPGVMPGGIPPMGWVGASFGTPGGVAVIDASTVPLGIGVSGEITVADGVTGVMYGTNGLGMDVGSACVGAHAVRTRSNPASRKILVFISASN